MKKILLIFITHLLLISSLQAGKEIEFSREFTLLTSQHAQGYLKPLFTTLGESFNSGLYTKADYKKTFSLGFDITVMGMYIPTNQKTYDAELPDLYGNTSVVLNAIKKDGKLIENVRGTWQQPTIYGGRSQPIFAAPQNNFEPDSFYRSIAFIEGNNIRFMSGLPVLQAFIGLPTRTQIRGRFFSVPIDGTNFTYYTIVLNQNIDKIFGLFASDNHSLALHFAYHSMKRLPGFEITSFAVGTHYSYELANNLYANAGMQYEDLKGKFRAIKEQSDDLKKIKSPYPEIREARPFEFDIESFTKFRIGGGLSYKLGPIELTASAYYASQPVLSTGLTVYLLDFKEKKPAPPPPPAPEPEPIPEPVFAEEVSFEQPTFEQPEVKLEEKRTLLKADIQAFALENGTEKPLLVIKMEENISKHISPLLPMVFFDENSAEIPARYEKITPDSAKKMIPKDVAEGNALDVYHRILNIIGMRLKKYPDANLTLTGTNSGTRAEKNNTRLSQSRAESIKNYLVNVWGINPNRIKTVARNLPAKTSNSKEPDGIMENRRVEISSDDWDVIAPSVIQDTARIILPPILRFRPNVESQAGIADWRLIVSASARKVKEESGKGDIVLKDWYVQDDETAKALIRNNMQYNLSVTDNEGNSFLTDVHTLPVELKTISKETAKSGDTITNIYDLILFDFDKSTLSGDNMKIIDMIKKEMPPNSIVKIVGYTDRMGNDDYNARLSLSRAKSAAQALGRPDAITIGSGESVLLYNNDLPEGRFYSRTVIIEVKIPVK